MRKLGLPLWFARDPFPPVGIFRVAPPTLPPCESPRCGVDVDCIHCGRICHVFGERSGADKRTPRRRVSERPCWATGGVEQGPTRRSEDAFRGLGPPQGSEGESE